MTHKDHLYIWVWKPGIRDEGLVISGVLHILCSQGGPHGCSVSVISASCTFGLCLTLPKASLQSPRVHTCHTWASRFKKPRKAQPIITKNSRHYSLSFSSDPPTASQMPVCPHKRTAFLATAPCAQQYHSDGAGGSPLGPSGRTTHKSCRSSTPATLCHCLAKGEHFWKHWATAEKNFKDIILDYFNFIIRTKQP